jgi:hypothetical protein
MMVVGERALTSGRFSLVGMLSLEPFILKALGSPPGLGADVTLYRTSTDLSLPYGRPLSSHVFLWWRPDAPSSAHLH